MTLVDGAAKKLDAHVWERETNEHYVEPEWCSRRLIEEEGFFPDIWDPCCGFGTIPKAAAGMGISARGTDIIDRGYAEIESVQNFLTTEVPLSINIVCNPPFNIASKFVEKAVSFDSFERGAFVFPTARLNAAHWVHALPLARVWLMTPRPSMPPGHVIARGEKPGGGKMDFCWLVFEQGFKGAAEIRWLRRDALPRQERVSEPSTPSEPVSVKDGGTNG